MANKKEHKDQKLKGLGKLKYILFLLKPYWEYGKLYMLITIAVSVLLKPLSTYLATLLPQKAIDALMAGEGRRELLLTIGLYMALVTVFKRIFIRKYGELL